MSTPSERYRAAQGQQVVETAPAEGAVDTSAMTPSQRARLREGGASLPTRDPIYQKTYDRLDNPQGSEYEHEGPAAGYYDFGEGEAFGKAAAMAGPAALNFVLPGSGIIGGTIAGAVSGLTADWAQRNAGFDAPETDLSHGTEYAAYGSLPAILQSALTRRPVVGLAKNILRHSGAGAAATAGIKTVADWLRGNEFDPYGTAVTGALGGVFSAPGGVASNVINTKAAQFKAQKEADAVALAQDILGQKAARDAAAAAPPPPAAPEPPPPPPVVNLAEDVLMDYPKPERQNQLRIEYKPTVTTEFRPPDELRGRPSAIERFEGDPNAPYSTIDPDNPYRYQGDPDAPVSNIQETWAPDESKGRRLHGDFSMDDYNITKGSDGYYVTRPGGEPGQYSDSELNLGTFKRFGEAEAFVRNRRGRPLYSVSQGRAGDVPSRNLPVIPPERVNTPPGIRRTDTQTANPWVPKDRDELQSFAENVRQPPKTDSEPPRQPPKTGLAGPGGQQGFSDILDPFRYDRGNAGGGTLGATSGGTSSPPPAEVTPPAASTEVPPSEKQWFRFDRKPNPYDEPVDTPEATERAGKLLFPWAQKNEAPVAEAPASVTAPGPGSGAIPLVAQGKLTNPDGSPVYTVTSSGSYPLRTRPGLFETIDSKFGYPATRIFGGLVRNPQAMARFGEEGLVTKLMDNSGDVFQNEARFSTRVKALMQRLHPQDRPLIAEAIYDSPEGKLARDKIREGDVDQDTKTIFEAIQDEIEDLQSLDGRVQRSVGDPLDSPNRLVQLKTDAVTGKLRKLNELEVGLPEAGYKKYLPRVGPAPYDGGPRKGMLDFLPDFPRSRQVGQILGSSPASVDPEGILAIHGRRLAEETSLGHHFGWDSRRVTQLKSDTPLFKAHPDLPEGLADDAERMLERRKEEGAKGKAVYSMFEGTTKHLLDRNDPETLMQLARVVQGLTSDVALGLSAFSNFGQRKMIHIFLGDDWAKLGQLEYDRNEVIPHIGKTPREVIEGSGALTTGMTREFLASGAGRETWGFRALEWVENSRLRSRDSWGSVAAAISLSKEMANNVDLLNSSAAAWQAKLLGWDPSDLASRRGVFSENDMTKTHKSFVRNTQYFNAPGEVSPGTQMTIPRMLGLQWQTYALRQPSTWDANIKNLLTSGDKELQKLGATFLARATVYQTTASYEAAILRSIVSGKILRNTNIFGPESDQKTVGPVEMGMNLSKQAFEGTFGAAAAPMSAGVEAMRGFKNAPDESTFPGRAWEGAKAGVSEFANSFTSSPFSPLMATAKEASFNHPEEALLRGSALAFPTSSAVTPMLTEWARKRRLATSEAP